MAPWAPLRYPFTMSLASRALTHRFLAGVPVSTAGMLLLDQREAAAGRAVLLDPSTGGELAASKPPVFRLSTEREATDGHIVRQFWDVSRAETVGIPVLWGHNARGQVFGQWRDLRVEQLADGPALVGSPVLDLDLPEAATIEGQIRRGFVRAVSIGWKPGATTRRGALDPSDPLYKAPVDDECGQPEEGLVMGSPELPNRLMECSLVPVPADDGAFVVARLFDSADNAARALVDGGRSGQGGYDALLARIGADPSAIAFLRRQIREHMTSPEGRALLVDLLRAEAAILGGPAPSAPSPDDLDW